MNVHGPSNELHVNNLLALEVTHYPNVPQKLDMYHDMQMNFDKQTNVMHPNPNIPDPSKVCMIVDRNSNNGFALSCDDRFNYKEYQRLSESIPGRNSNPPQPRRLWPDPLNDCAGYGKDANGNRLGSSTNGQVKLEKGVQPDGLMRWRFEDDDCGGEENDKKGRIVLTLKKP